MKVREARRARRSGAAVFGKEKTQRDIVQDLHRTLAELPVVCMPRRASSRKNGRGGAFMCLPNSIVRDWW